MSTLDAHKTYNKIQDLPDFNSDYIANKYFIDQIH